jgi:hypothetical protein
MRECSVCGGTNGGHSAWCGKSKATPALGLFAAMSLFLSVGLLIRDDMWQSGAALAAFCLLAVATFGESIAATMEAGR